jgi:histidine triad (HIT) family protein
VASIFTRIINGEIPGRFVWSDDAAVAFLPVALLAPGHTLVVPREEVDHWIDLEPDVNAHLWKVSQIIATALQETFNPTKVGVMVVGEEVPHVHVHLVPFTDLSQFNFANADTSPEPADLDDYTARTRATLRTHGHAASVPD